MQSCNRVGQVATSKLAVGERGLHQFDFRFEARSQKPNAFSISRRDLAIFDLGTNGEFIQFYDRTAVNNFAFEDFDAASGEVHRDLHATIQDFLAREFSPVDVAFNTQTIHLDDAHHGFTGLNPFTLVLVAFDDNAVQTRLDRTTVECLLGSLPVSVLGQRIWVIVLEKLHAAALQALRDVKRDELVAQHGWRILPQVRTRSLLRSYVPLPWKLTS